MRSFVRSCGARATFATAALLSCAVLTVAACSSETTASGGDAGPGLSLGEGGYLDAQAPDGNKAAVDGGFLGPDGAVLRADRFAMNVVSFTPGDCAGFGVPSMPDIVLGPPVGAGAMSGSTDVVSLGSGGEIVLSVEPNAIIDGPGTDLLVFENTFYIAGDPTRPNAELAEVSVSEDGTTWKTFPCTVGPGAQHGTCAGWHPVYSAPGNGISPVDPSVAGGDPFDLADVGLTSAKLIRIRDLGTVSCPSNPADKPITVGFDLDAIAVVNAKIP